MYYNIGVVTIIILYVSKSEKLYLGGDISKCDKIQIVDLGPVAYSSPQI